MKKKEGKKESRREICERLLHSRFHHHVEFVPQKRGKKGERNVKEDASSCSS